MIDREFRAKLNVLEEYEFYNGKSDGQKGSREETKGAFSRVKETEGGKERGKERGGEGGREGERLREENERGQRKESAGPGR